MKKTFLIIGFIAMVLLQWSVPASMLLEQEAIISKGTAYKFRTQPIDPTDPFRGKYVTLNYQLSSFDKATDSVPRGEELYVYLETDADGFAKVDRISHKDLIIDQDFVIAESRGYYRGVQRFRLPFNRYYMEESKAYEAEIAVRIASRDSLPNNCYALVYVKGAEVAVSDVLIDEVSIKEYVEEQRKIEKE